MNIKPLNHIAFIMDGNGRYATNKNQPRTFGHLEGIKVIPKVIDSAINANINHISLFAFSVENWNRPKTEVDFLINLLSKYLTKKTIDYLNKKNIKINWIGFKDNLDKTLLKNINTVVDATKKNTTITVNIFFNYSGQKDIDKAFEFICNNNIQTQSIKPYLLTKDLPPIDLLVRTGNEKRISNFALYDLAYAEIIFEPTLWPNYDHAKFLDNIKEYYNRDRRFGKINEQ